ncbi:MAG: Crp/Fnr family transcriptional regulator [Gammaproteobacteria bacterium]|nr:Crp/Fnr family transcriptional regulator [Gammaproteobacteria bacterium]
MDPIERLFSQSPWNQCLNPAQRDRVLTSLFAKHYAAGEVICRKGDISDVWIGIAEGLVQLSIESKHGKQLSLATGIPPGSWFGEGSLLKKERRKYNVVALRRSTIVFMPAETFFELLDENFAFNRFLLIQINERLGQFIGNMEHDRLLSPEEKVAQSLATMFNSLLYPNTDSKLSITQEELGNLAGISRQRVNQALHLLQGQGILTVKYGEISILDMDALRAFEQ